MEFEVKMLYGKKDFYAFGNALLWRKANTRSAMLLRKWGTRLVGGCMIFFGVLGMFALSFSPESANESLGSMPWILCSAFGAIGVVLIYSKSPIDLGRSAGKRYSGGGGEVVYRFGEARFSEHIPTSDIQMDYSVIQRVLEAQNHYFLFVNQNAAFILRKDRFTQGDSTRFGPWLEEKTGKEIVHIS